MNLFRTEWADRSGAQLLRAVAAGEAEALAALYDRHAGRRHVRIGRRCAGPETVDDPGAPSTPVRSPAGSPGRPLTLT